MSNIVMDEIKIKTSKFPTILGLLLFLLILGFFNVIINANDSATKLNKNSETLEATVTDGKMFCFNNRPCVQEIHANYKGNKIKFMQKSEPFVKTGQIIKVKKLYFERTIIISPAKTHSVYKTDREFTYVLLTENS